MLRFRARLSAMYIASDKAKPWDRGIQMVRTLVQLVAALFAGAVGGFIIATSALLLAFLVGTSGYTGAEPGRWEWGAATWFGVFFGAPLGAIAFAIGYYRYLHNAATFRDFVVAFVATACCALIGVLAGPPIGAVTALVGFWVACARLAKSRAKAAWTDREVPT